MRLCVETARATERSDCGQWAAAFVRLCVETTAKVAIVKWSSAAAFVRLCVETQTLYLFTAERDAAAFVRLCVETEF